MPVVFHARYTSTPLSNTLFILTWLTFLPLPSSVSDFLGRFFECFAFFGNCSPPIIEPPLSLLTRNRRRDSLSPCSSSRAFLLPCNHIRGVQEHETLRYPMLNSPSRNRVNGVLSYVCRRVCVLFSSFRCLDPSNGSSHVVPNRI